MIKNKNQIDIKINFSNKNYDYSIYTDEQKNILLFLKEQFLKNNIKFDREIDISLNYNFSDHGEYDDGQFEIDGVIVFERNKIINVLLIEFKHYINPLCNNWKKDSELIKSKAIKFFKYFFWANDKKIVFYSLFIWKDNQSNNNYEIFKMTKNMEMKKIILSYFLLNDIFNKKSKFLSSNYLNDIAKEPRDINYIKKIILNEENIFKEKLLNDIWTSISNNKVTFIEGNAGTGKTVLAFYLFYKLENSFFWLINDKFANSIISQFKKDKFLKDKITNNFYFHFKDIEKLLNDISKPNSKNKFYLIIDEVQRVWEEQGNKILYVLSKYSNFHLIILGDKKQVINLKTEQCSNCFIDKCKLFYKKEIKLNKCYRFKNETLIIIKHILFIESNNKSCNKDNSYEINIFNDIDKFMKKFNQYLRKNSKLVMLTTQLANTELLNINKFLGTNKLKKNISYLDSNEYLKSYYLSPYDVISREVDISFIFIDKNTKLENGRIVNNLFKNKMEFLKNQLYVLASRATKKLFVFIEDEEYYKFSLERKNKIYGN